jgi:ectoine hydroxylase-related dioxygenase (phytanoyl-CoA dioxygenase family)
MQAPAGAALIYDSRTWHRACPELNVSGEDRLAILNAVCPAWVRSMVDKQPGTKHYRASNMAAQLEPLVRDEIEALCHADRVQSPAGVPNILEKQFVGPRKIQI